MVTIICGWLGSGKSLRAMEVLEHGVLAGRPVASNIELTDECYFKEDVVLLGRDESEPMIVENPNYQGKGRGKPKNPWAPLTANDLPYRAFWHNWAAVPGSVIVIDEADVELDCTMHAAMGVDLPLYLKMSRKFGHDLYFIVQDVQNLYVRVRRMAQRFELCYNSLRSNPIFQVIPLPDVVLKTFGRFERAVYSDEELKNQIAYGFISYTDAERLFGWFRTEQLIGSLGWLSEVNGENEAK